MIVGPVGAFRKATAMTDETIAGISWCMRGNNAISSSPNGGLLFNGGSCGGLSFSSFPHAQKSQKNRAAQQKTKNCKLTQPNNEELRACTTSLSSYAKRMCTRDLY